jgi:hypothetical protein
VFENMNHVHSYNSKEHALASDLPYTAALGLFDLHE